MSHLGRRLSALVDGELSNARRERALAHLARCEACRREAVAMRALKHRMRTLGEATVAVALTDRLVALGNVPPAGYIGKSRRRVAAAVPWHRGSRLALGALALLALAVPALGFLAGGQSRHQPGPSVSPAVDLFVEQHALTPAPHVRLTATTAPVPPGNMWRLVRQDR